MIFQLIPIACPDHFATGDVYHLLTILRQAPEHCSLRLYNQDLAGFFTSIVQQRFIGAWHMLLDLLRPHMNVGDNEVFSVYPGRSNNPGDLIKGRTFRRLNVTHCHTENPHQGHSVPAHHCLEHADFLLGTPLCVPTTGQSHG